MHLQDLPPESTSFDISRNAVVSTDKEPSATSLQNEDWEPSSTRHRFTVSLSYAPKKLNMNYAPVRRARLDPYEQKYGKDMYMSDISDSDSESRTILISKGRKKRCCR